MACAFEPSSGWGVYISFPFCRQKCAYCNFASGVFGADVQGAYLPALAAEIRQSERPAPAETLYLGGGTPSLLAPTAFEALSEALGQREWLEATIEAAPGDLTDDKLRIWRKAGINRISLGVQTFDRRVAARAGRKHTPELIASEIQALRAAGIRRISVDLIAGLAFQTPATWRADLDWIERLELDHVSIYMLEVDDDSRLGAELRSGGGRYGARSTPSEEEILEFYQVGAERLRSLGIERYEISNFARPNVESLHNWKYWSMQPYIGFGADAHSFDGARRWNNVKTAVDYVNRWRRGRTPVANRETIDARRRLEDSLLTGLRTVAGVTIEEADWRLLESKIDALAARGWIATDDRRLRLTPAGALFSNDALCELLS